MITLRPGPERGSTQLHWLDSRHTFSFAHYHDPSHMGFQTLRVINEDWIQPGTGFGTHPHSDMEILSFILDGELEHKDSMGNGSVIRPGEVQRMTAGTGVRHSEHNPSSTRQTHLLQVWMLPERRGLAPGYEQRFFPGEEKRERWRVVASRDGRDGSVTIHQDASVHETILDPGKERYYELQPGRHAWIHACRGLLTLNGQELRAGDGAAASDETRLDFRGIEPAAALLFDMA
jgi:redox-sensitive bicupin YhaK (pirin superfamily)